LETKKQSDSLPVPLGTGVAGEGQSGARRMRRIVLARIALALSRSRREGGPQFTAFSCLLLSCIVLAGCGPSRPATAPVSGRVTYAGKPVGVGQIMFQPEEGRPALGSLGADGRYTLTTFKSGDGAPLGKHRVMIEAKQEVGGSPPPKSRLEEFRGGVGAPPAIQWLVPEKYSRPETTPLKAEVTSGANAIDFDLPARP
jgi:hypothetical protein